MTTAAAYLGMFRSASARGGEPREFAAFNRATAWLNSPPLTAASLQGKVVLVDFWTYTCINWLRTMPYIRAWRETYADRLVIIGVHTPEFPFEHDVDNVRHALQQMRIEYPVAIDNDYAIWRAFNNQYWPALYAVDGRGRVRQHYFGEADYDKAELALQRLLKDRGAAPGRESATPVNAIPAEALADWADLRSPETYVGYDRMENFASRGLAPDRRHLYAAPPSLAVNEWALQGEWTVGRQATTLHTPSGRIAYRFHARDLHLVMGPTQRGRPVRFRVSIDAQPPGAAHFLDVDADGHGVVVEPRLYQLIRQPAPIVDRRFEIEFLDAGVDAFSFTFG